MPRVPQMTRAPQKSSHQALTEPPKKVPACRSGMARSASLAEAPAAAKNRSKTARTIGFRSFMDTHFPCHGQDGRDGGAASHRGGGGRRTRIVLSCGRELLEDGFGRGGSQG